MDTLEFDTRQGQNNHRVTTGALLTVSRSNVRTLPIQNARSNALAERLERGAVELTKFVESVSDAEWAMPTPKDGRKVGVIVHHVAMMYPLEIQLATQIAEGKPIEGVTWDEVAAINAAHAQDFVDVTKAEALELLARNSAAAAQAIRKFTDEELDRANTISLNSDAPLTCQFFLEDHAVRHSYHHLKRLRAAVGR